MANDPKDFGTPEIAKRFKVVPTLVSPNAYAGRIVDETMIDILLLKDKITASDHSALERFMEKLMKANFVGIRSPSYEAPLSADPSLVGDRRANQIRAVVGLFKRLDKDIGPPKRKALVDLVLKDAEWPGDDASLVEAVRSLGMAL